MNVDRSPENAARIALRDLRRLGEEQRGNRPELSIFLWKLVAVHAYSEGGGLIGSVDGEDFAATVVRLLTDRRKSAESAIGQALLDVESARLDNLVNMMVRRSGVQYLMDDFPDTVVGDLVDPALLAEADETLEERLSYTGVPAADDRPPRVPASHWWWWRTTREAPAPPEDRGRVFTLYTGGATRGEERRLFSVVERDYPSGEAAAAAFREGSDAVRRAGVSAGVVSDPYTGVRPTAPTWEEFRQRHFVDGVPLPKGRAPRPEDHREPPGWRAMWAELERVRAALRTELTEVLHEAFPGLDSDVTVDRGPVNQTPGAWARADERYGLDVEVTAYDPPPPPRAVDLVTRVLGRRDWEVGRPRAQPDMLTADGRRDAFEVSVFAREDSVAVMASSPLYRAPAEPGSSFVVEPRRPAT